MRVRVKVRVHIRVRARSKMDPLYRLEQKDLNALSRIGLITGVYKSNGAVHTIVGFFYRSARNSARDLVRVSIPARVRR